MALVQVDLSEYDMLREAKNKAEKELDETKKQLESLKNTSSCVVKTVRYRKDYNNPFFLNLITEHFIKSLRCTNFGFEFSQSFISDCLKDSICRGIKDFEIYHNSSDIILKETVSDVIGFDSIKSEIKEFYDSQYKSSIDALKRDLDAQISEYNSKLSSVNEIVKKKYLDDIKELKAALADKEKKYEELEAQLREAKKSTKEKIAEAEEKVRIATQELEALKSTPKKKGLFNLFSK